jgi:aspartate racemase
VNFGDIAALNEKGDREGIYQLIKDASEKVKHAGAEGLVLCANTLHMLADRLKEEIDIPIIHIAEATAKEINLEGLSRVGLLGTRFTMEEDFYISKLKAANIETIVPEKGDREYAHAVIFDELMKEIFKPESKSGCLEIMDKLRQKGAEGIILGCTEFPLIIKEDDLDLPLFDTTAIHARAAVDFALGR